MVAEKVTYASSPPLRSLLSLPPIFLLVRRGVDMFVGVSYIPTQRAYNTPNNQFHAEQAVKQSHPLDHCPVSQNRIL